MFKYISSILLPPYLNDLYINKAKCGSFAVPEPRTRRLCPYKANCQNPLPRCVNYVRGLIICMALMRRYSPCGLPLSICRKSADMISIYRPINQRGEIPTSG